MLAVIWGIFSLKIKLILYESRVIDKKIFLIEFLIFICDDYDAMNHMPIYFLNND